MSDAGSREARLDRRFSGWLLVGAAALLMGVAGIYQFGWSSIRLPLGARLGAPEPALGTVFTLFVTFQTVSQFPAGWVRDRYGPRRPLLVGSAFLFAGFAGIGYAGSLLSAYVAYAVGGIGAGVCYTVAVNTPVKWFTTRRGLATGVVTMSYSVLSVVLIPGIRAVVAERFTTTLLALGGFAGVASLVGVFVLDDPDAASSEAAAGPPADAPAGDSTADAEAAYTWREAVRTWQFWLLYGVFVVVNGVGLMLVGKVVAYAAVLDLPASAATASASLVALAEASGLLVVGTLSDRFGRRRTVATSLALAGVATGTMVLAGQRGLAVGFVLFAALASFLRSPPFAVFPSLVGSYYGRAYSSEVYAALYSAKLFGGVIAGTVASGLVLTVGWSESFGLGAVLLLAAGLALFLLRPVGGA